MFCSLWYFQLTKMRYHHTLEHKCAIIISILENYSLDHSILYFLVTKSIKCIHEKPVVD